VQIAARARNAREIASALRDIFLRRREDEIIKPETIKSNK
jgi:hypothetical protein